VIKPAKLYYVSDILSFHYCVFNNSLSLLVHLLALWWSCRLVASSRQCFLLFLLVAFPWYLVEEISLLLTVLDLLPKVIKIFIAHIRARGHNHRYCLEISSTNCNYYFLLPWRYVLVFTMAAFILQECRGGTATYCFSEHLLWKCQSRGQWKRKLQEVVNKGLILRSTAAEVSAGGAYLGFCLS